MTARSRTPQKPHTRTKAAREKAIVSAIDPDKEWADKIWQTLLAGCHPYQYDVVTDPARRYSMLVGRGGAKTTSFRVRGVRKITAKAQAKVLYFAQTGKRAKDLNWHPLKALLHRLGFEVGRDVIYNETELKCTMLRTGSIYQLSGLEDTATADKWRGDTWDEVQYDECGAIKPELLEYSVVQCIGPRVRCLGVGGTPGRDRRGRFYDATRPGSEKHRPYHDRENYPNFTGYSSHHWTLRDVMMLPDAAAKYPALDELWRESLVEKEAERFSDDNPIWLREYMAVWAVDNTLRVFSSFDPERNTWDPFDGKGLVEGVQGLRVALAKLKTSHPEFTDWRFVVAKDQGHKDPFGIAPLAFSPNDPERRIWQVMSFEKTGMGYGKPIAELLIGAEQVDTFVKTSSFPTKYGGVFGETGWPDGMIIDCDNALLEDLKNVYGIATEKADKKPEYKKGAIELVNGDLHDGRIKALKDSPLHKQLEQLQWKEQPNGTLIEDPAQANHNTDCLVYGRSKIAAMFAAGQVAQDEKRSNSATTYRDPMGLGPGIGNQVDSDDEDGLRSPSEWHDDDEDY